MGEFKARNSNWLAQLSRYTVLVFFSPSRCGGEFFLGGWGGGGEGLINFSVAVRGVCPHGECCIIIFSLSSSRCARCLLARRAL